MSGRARRAALYTPPTLPLHICALANELRADTARPTLSLGADSAHSVSLSAAAYLATLLPGSSSLEHLVIDVAHVSAAALRALLLGASQCRRLRSLTVSGGLTSAEGRALAEGIAAFAHPRRAREAPFTSRTVAPLLSPCRGRARPGVQCARSATSSSSTAVSSGQSTPAGRRGRGGRARGGSSVHLPVSPSSAGRGCARVQAMEVGTPRVASGGVAWRCAERRGSCHPFSLPATPRTALVADDVRGEETGPCPAAEGAPAVAVTLLPFRLDEPTARDLLRGCRAGTRVTAARVHVQAPSLLHRPVRASQSNGSPLLAPPIASALAKSALTALNARLQSVCDAHRTQHYDATAPPHSSSGRAPTAAATKAAAEPSSTTLPAATAATAGVGGVVIPRDFYDRQRSASSSSNRAALTPPSRRYSPARFVPRANEERRSAWELPARPALTPPTSARRAEPPIGACTPPRCAPPRRAGPPRQWDRGAGELRLLPTPFARRAVAAVAAVLAVRGTRPCSPRSERSASSAGSWRRSPNATPSPPPRRPVADERAHHDGLRARYAPFPPHSAAPLTSPRYADNGRLRQRLLFQRMAPAAAAGASHGTAVPSPWAPRVGSHVLVPDTAPVRAEPRRYASPCSSSDGEAGELDLSLGGSSSLPVRPSTSASTPPLTADPLPSHGCFVRALLSGERVTAGSQLHTPRRGSQALRRRSDGLSDRRQPATPPSHPPCGGETTPAGPCSSARPFARTHARTQSSERDVRVVEESLRFRTSPVGSPPLRLTSPFRRRLLAERPREGPSLARELVEAVDADSASAPAADNAGSAREPGVVLGTRTPRQAAGAAHRTDPNPRGEPDVQPAQEEPAPRDRSGTLQRPAVEPCTVNAPRAPLPGPSFGLTMSEIERAVHRTACGLKRRAFPLLNTPVRAAPPAKDDHAGSPFVRTAVTPSDGPAGCGGPPDAGLSTLAPAACALRDGRPASLSPASSPSPSPSSVSSSLLNGITPVRDDPSREPTPRLSYTCACGGGKPAGGQEGREPTMEVLPPSAAATTVPQDAAALALGPDDAPYYCVVSAPALRRLQHSVHALDRELVAYQTTVAAEAAALASRLRADSSPAESGPRARLALVQSALAEVWSSTCPSEKK